MTQKLATQLQGIFMIRKFFISNLTNSFGYSFLENIDFAYRCLPSGPLWYVLSFIYFQNFEVLETIQILL